MTVCEHPPAFSGTVGTKLKAGATSASIAGRRCPRATRFADIAGGSMDIDGIKVMVTGDPYPNEIEGYVRRGLREHGKRLTAMEITLDGADCDIHYILKRPFERIRRITGYLVGTTDRFNNAKQAEEHDRVKHTIER